MTSFVSQPSGATLIKISGRISDYRCTRARASFVFVDSDRTKMGAVAVAAGLAGLGGQAMATAANAADIEEDADFVEFNIDGKAVKGWVWRSPFQDGDIVSVVAEFSGAGYEVFAVARQSDNVVALYPHCSRGMTRHLLNAIKWWLILVGFVVLWMAAGDFWMHPDRLPFQKLEAIAVAGGLSLFFGAMVFSLSRRWLPFVRVAENVFRTLGWPNPSMIDLKKRTKAQRTKDDPVELGVFYFRY